MRVTCIFAMCAKSKDVCHQTMLVNACKMNVPHMDLSIQIICHEMILLTTSSALSFIIYVCRYILGGMVTDVLGHPRHVAFVATCS